MSENKNQLITKCFNILDEQEIINFAAELIRIPSYPPEFNEKDVALAVANKLGTYGIDARIDDLEQENRANLIASIGDAERPHMVFSGHLDTVPPIEHGWNYDPFGAEIEHGIMYGRGTCDMKGGVASLVMAMCILKKVGVDLKGKLSYVGTAGEEVDLYGAKAYKKKFGCDDIDAMVVAEATNREVCLGEKGALWVKFISHGKASHPTVTTGVNALLNMLEFFEVFRRYQFDIMDHALLGSPLLNITTMHSGTITNSLPDTCVATVDMRTVPGVTHDRILKDIDRLLKQLNEADPEFRVEYEVTMNNPAIETSLDNSLAKVALQTYKEVFGNEVEPAGVNYYTDAAAMTTSDGQVLPLVVYGPGNVDKNHKVNESVEIDQLIDSTKYYIGLAINYLT